MIILAAVPAGAQSQEIPAGKEKAAAEAQNEPESPKDTAAKGTDARPWGGPGKWRWVLGMGSLASFYMGGGELHEGFETAGINPVTSISAGVFFTEGFAMGIEGCYRHLKMNVAYTMRMVPLTIKTSADLDAGWAALNAQYFFKASERVHLYLGLSLGYGGGKGSAMEESFSETFIIVSAMGGVQFMIAPHVGLCLEVVHLRDIVAPGKENRTGHLTGIGAGFRIYIPTKRG